MSSKVKTDIKKAVKMIEACSECAQILPEVGSNIAMALLDAKKLEEVAGLTGRIIRVEDKAIGVGEPKFGATHFMGTVLLAAMKHNPEFRAVINLKYSPEIVRICEELGMEARTYEWKEKPKEAIQMKCTIPFTIDILQKAPEVVYDVGDVGVEALTTVFGRTAIDVAEKAIKIAKKYSGRKNLK
ncbi:MAG: hydroxymethylpyrimidine kinase / phosphomethylpyrimidine kinase / thiamine-phosphate diphosphorylase [Thermoproteota archaeon]|nr:hydroxymethylpyrimidine kinase / phosphomethylpyrimidine kinase / thiamine-phosphate diphosphorylase [Thermoproteota archaeon]